MIVCGGRAFAWGVEAVSAPQVAPSDELLSCGTPVNLRARH